VGSYGEDCVHAFCEPRKLGYSWDIWRSLWASFCEPRKLSYSWDIGEVCVQAFVSQEN